MAMRPKTLLPWIAGEAISVTEAAAIAGRSDRTIRNWAERFQIGRKVVGEWAISRPALWMLLQSDKIALSAYLSGERKAEPVAAYFKRANLKID